MNFLPMMDLLRPAAADGYAVPAFCIWNAETMIAVLSVAADLRSPVILMSGPGEFPLLPPADMAAVGRAVARRFNVRAAFHLDHGNSLEQVKSCLEAGYTSVMLDYSSRPYAENVAALRQVVEWARPAGVTVEGEIGHVGKADTLTAEGQGASTLTEVAEAVAYAAETQVDALAISFGNAHGHYPKLPQLDFDRLAAIRSGVRHSDCAARRLRHTRGRPPPRHLLGHRQGQRGHRFGGGATGIAACPMEVRPQPLDPHCPDGSD